MAKITPTLRVAALGAMVLGFAWAGFIASAFAKGVAKGDGDKKAFTDVHGEGNNSTLRSNNVTDISSGGGERLQLARPRLRDGPAAIRPAKALC